MMPSHGFIATILCFTAARFARSASLADRGTTIPSGSSVCSTAADVAARQDADPVAEVRAHPGAPRRIDGSLPRRAPHHVRRLKMIDRNVAMRAAVGLR